MFNNAAKIQRYQNNPERGSVLLVSIIMLIAITMMSIVAMKSSILQEKLAAGAMDQNIAFQAAESALRDAEIYINASLDAGAGFNLSCTNGLCYPSKTTISVWDSITDWQSSGIPIVFGTQTATPAIADVAIQPRYIIELLPDIPSPTGETSAYGALAGGTAFRITAVGWGKRASTPVMLQSIYIKI